jgi:hypothetical protein
VGRRTHPQIPTWRRNLSRRLPKPAEGRGRVQRACRRALLVHGTASTSDVIAWAYAQRLLIWGDSRRNDFNRAARRALVAIGAIKVGKAQNNGPAAPVALARDGWTLREKEPLSLS